MIFMKQKKVFYKIIIVVAVAFAFITPTSLASTNLGISESSHQNTSDAMKITTTEPITNERGGGSQTVTISHETPQDETPKAIPTGITIYVKDDSVYPGNGTLLWPYHFIWQGVQNATDGDTIYVFNGTYYENIVVDKSIDIIGESRDATIVNGSDTGRAFYVTANNVFIGHFTIENNDAIGILLASKYNQVLDCFCVRMGWIYGIWVTDSNNQITNCICLNSYIGIYVGSDSNHQLHVCREQAQRPLPVSTFELQPGRRLHHSKQPGHGPAHRAILLKSVQEQHHSL